MELLSALKIPVQYGKYLRLFKENKINYSLFKQTREINQEIGGLDVLFKTDENYSNAKLILIKNGFLVYLSEKNEPYKTMMVKYEKDFLLIFHIQRRIGWLGINVLDHSGMFNHIVPSKEDSLLIHSAHILFENYKINYEKKIFDKFRKNADFTYINHQLKKFGWKKQFYSVINNTLNNELILKAHLNRLFKRDFFKLAHYLIKQFIQFFTKRANFRTKGLFISFDGVNGCGKSTLSKCLVDYYNKINQKLNLVSKYYYFGWVPLLPLTKVLSKISRNNKIYETAVKEKVPKFSVKYELFFLYIFFDYLARYLFHIYPKLRKKQAVITDRSFYHVYGQYPYSKNSVLMPWLIGLFPKADLAFLIDTNLNDLAKRRKEISRDQLIKQRENYLALSKLNGKIKILEPTDLNKTVKTIYESIWRKQFKKLKY